MGNFNMPRFQYILNNDEQAQLFGNSGAGPVPYDALLLLDPTNSGHSISVVGELDWTPLTGLVLQAAATRIRAEAPNAGTLQSLVATVGGAATAVEEGHVFRVVTSMPSLEQTAYQNIPIEKRYQIPRACVLEAEVATAIADAINADPNSLVDAVAAANTVTLTDKQIGASSAIYVGLAPDASLPVWTLTSVVTPGSLPVNVYQALKNIQWSNSVDVDRNIEYYPERGASYNSYHMLIQATEIATGGHSLPSQLAGVSETEHIFYVKVGTDLDIAFAALVVDVNV